MLMLINVKIFMLIKCWNIQLKLRTKFCGTAQEWCGSAGTVVLVYSETDCQACFETGEGLPQPPLPVKDMNSGHNLSLKFVNANIRP